MLRGGGGAGQWGRGAGTTSRGRLPAQQRENMLKNKRRRVEPLTTFVGVRTRPHCLSACVACPSSLSRSRIDPFRPIAPPHTPPPPRTAKMSVHDFSALYCPPTRAQLQFPRPHKAPLVGWKVELDLPLPAHPCFDHRTGVYLVDKEGLYSVVVQLIPIGGPLLMSHHVLARTTVEYVLRIEEPPVEGVDEDEIVDADFRDVGPHNFAEMLHLKQGARLTCIRMPSGVGTECVRFKVQLLQRKRKRATSPILTKKQLKKRKMNRRKAQAAAAARSDQYGRCYSGAETSKSCGSDSSDSEWSNGFDSDTSQDHLDYSNRGVNRLAKRLKTVPVEDLH